MDAFAMLTLTDDEMIRALASLDDGPEAPPVFCADEVHRYLKDHPQGIVNLREWPGLPYWIGECAHCFTSLMVPAGWEQRACEVTP